MGSIGRSWALVTQSWGVLRGEGALVLFPILSGLVVIIAVLLLSGVVATLYALAPPVRQAADAAVQGQPTMLSYALGIAGLFLFYLVISVVVTFFTAALVGAALQKLRGEATSVGAGLRIAGGHAGAILGYAAIAATVGVVLSFLRGRGGERRPGRAVVAGLGRDAWDLATFLVVPVLVGEGLGPVPALKRSVDLLRRTWGEQIVGVVGIGAAFGLLTLGVVAVGVVLTIGLATAGLGTAAPAVIAVTLLAVIVLAIVQSALGALYKAAVYLYAIEGRAPAAYSADLVQAAFKPETMPA
jgi:hypothetical protein